jgi:predicted MFS family arabinose efflux permease
VHRRTVCHDRSVTRERESLLTQIAIAAAAAMVLADGSIVVLALPQLLSALNTTVEGVAAVIAVYTAALAAALLPAEALRRRIGSARLGATGLYLVTGASLVCGLADSLPVMLLMRALQALGGAAALVAAFDLLAAGARRGGGGHLWMLAAIGGAAAGPALGGALTQAFSWSAIFFAQVPIALAGAIACRVAVAPDPQPDEFAPDLGAPTSGQADRSGGLRGHAIASVALLSAALTAVLFLLVLVIVAGWSFEPLAGALILTVLPLAALAATRVRGDPRVRAVAGSLLVAGGVAALAPMATASAWWTIAPELAAGAGMGLALPALTESLLPEHTPADAARVLTARHVGITAALLLLAPVIASRLDGAIQQAREREVAVMLDSNLNPVSKLTVVGKLVGDIGTSDPRGDLDRAFAEQRASTTGSQRVALDELQRRSDQTIVTAVHDTFWPAFLVAAAFALAAAIALLPVARDRGLTGAAGAAIAVPLVATVVGLAVAPTPVAIADPCRPRPPPQSGGVAGAVQGVVLRGLDIAACHFGSSREELVLALADDKDARRYQRRHGVNPRSLSSLMETMALEATGSQSLGDALRSLLQ